MSEKPTSYVRFQLAQRIEHILLIASFTTLAVTGLIQKFGEAGVSLWLIKILGGLTAVRVIHRIAATIFLLECIYHAIVIGYKLYVQRVEKTMLPGLQDAKDGIQAVGYNLGLAKSRPRLGRYTFDEKIEYWAMMWGNLVMIITGFMLWNPIKTTNILPGVIIPAAKAAHGWEAVLAVLAILIWHLYHVHIKTFNKSIFNGKLSRHEMEHEHGLELDHIEAGVGHVMPAPEVLRKRSRIYYPIAAVISVAALVGIYLFITAEQTAIATLPPDEEVPSISLAEPTALPTFAPTPTEAPHRNMNPQAASAAPTDLTAWDEGIGAVLQTKCGMCHGASGGLSVASYADLMKGGATGPVITAGDPSASLIIQILEAGGHPGQLSADELEALKTWILAGAIEK